MKQKNYYIKTYGCQMNNHDSEVMSEQLEKIGYLMTCKPDNADIIILNTCSVRDKAEQKVYSDLGRLKKIKMEKKDILIGVGGCVGKQEGNKIIKKMPWIDLVFGPEEIDKLSCLVTEIEKKNNFSLVDTFRINTNNNRSGFVSIMQGCDNFCSYCIVPYTRGRERSIPSNLIIREVEKRIEMGVKEITLLGQNVNSYGKGLGEDIDFPDLLRLINDIPGIEKIKFMTSHPKDLTDKLISSINDLPNVCKEVHLPLQSGSDKILELMNRGYTFSYYLERVNKLRNMINNINITSDIIVGFPFEEDDDFQKTIDAIDKIRFNHLFTFKYSPRPNTMAGKLELQVDENVKKDRLEQVLSLQTLIMKERI